MISLYAVVTSPLQHLHLLLLERRFGQTLTSEVARFSSQGDILLTGDFNARTGVLPDYSEHDSHKYISLPLNYKLDSSQMRVLQRNHKHAHHLTGLYYGCAGIELLLHSCTALVEASRTLFLDK